MLNKITSPNFGKAPTHRTTHNLFIAMLFVIVFIAARVSLQPINNTDYNITVEGLRAFLRGQSPYVSASYYMPPWSAVLLAPLANQPLVTWLALDVAIWVAITFDLGTPAGLLLLLHPAFIALIASSNQEWLLIGPGLWLLYRAPKGWLRGIAWLLLACKPQTTVFLLLFDGWDALRERDWKAVGLTIGIALVSLLSYPQFFDRLVHPYDNAFGWSATILPNYGIVGAVLATLIVIALRWTRLMDRKTLGLMLSPVWSPYMLEYSYVSTSFTMRGAGWLRTTLYLVGSIVLAYLFWRDYHVAEQIGAFGMVLLAALLAPSYNTHPTPRADESSVQLTTEHA